MAGSFAYASVSGGPGEYATQTTAAGPDLDDRDVWSQVSRGGEERRDLDFLEADPVTFTALIDDEELEITSGAGTLADALVDHGVLVGLEDEVSAQMNKPPQEGDEVEITRVGTVYGAETEVIEHDTVERRTSELTRGTTRVQTEGVDGQRVTTYVATYEDGEEVSRTIQSEILAAEPVTEVVLVGTAAPRPAPSNSGSSGSSSSSGSSDSSGSSGSSGSSSSSESSGSSGSSGSGGSSGSSYSGDPRSIARQMVADRGWGGDQFSCLDSLWQKESNWNHTAQNPSSGAYGIPQSLPGSKMASAGSDWRTNPATQITWGLNYIAGRYGTPCGAWAHSQSHNWY